MRRVSRLVRVQPCRGFRTGPGRVVGWPGIVSPASAQGSRTVLAVSVTHLLRSVWRTHCAPSESVVSARFLEMESSCVCLLLLCLPPPQSGGPSRRGRRELRTHKAESPPRLGRAPFEKDAIENGLAPRELSAECPPSPPPRPHGQLKTRCVPRAPQASCAPPSTKTKAHCRTPLPSRGMAAGGDSGAKRWPWRTLHLFWGLVVAAE
jgi:hypothetical protein